MRSKRITAAVLAVIAAAAMAGCRPASSQPEAPPQDAAAAPRPAPADVRVMALKGPTAMGMVKFMDDAGGGRITSNNYSFSLTGTVDEVAPRLIRGEADIAAVPANLASILYNTTGGEIKVLAVNTLGVLYIVEGGGSVNSVADLAGKTLYASGKGATPEYSLNYILEQNGIDPVSGLSVEWKSEHAECLAALMSDPGGIAMLPQPFVAAAQSQNGGIRVALDLTEEWDKLQQGKAAPSMLITGVVAARKGFIEQNPEAVSDFLDNYAASVQFVNADVEQAAALIGEYGIVPEQVAVKALPQCNITFIEGERMRDGLSGYLASLFEQDPQAVGGKLPADDFYFVR